MHILLADDDEDDCLFFKDAVKETRSDIQLHMVSNGDDLWEYLHNHESNLSDVIFLDMNMPCKNGAECAAEIKDTERLKNIPVVIISTSLDEHLVKSLYKNGAQWYIKKPNYLSHLKILIARVIELVKKGNFMPPTPEKFILTVENK